MSVTGVLPWVTRGGVKVLDPAAVAPELGERELRSYRYSVVPVGERPRPLTCGRPGAGRRAHRLAGEALCGVCRSAEAEYDRERRELRADGGPQ